MAQLVVNGAMMMCAAGTAPQSLTVLPRTISSPSGNPAANIMDAKPMVNIKPFGTCNILTAAAFGVTTPCVPATVAWAPGSPTVLIDKMPALNNTSTCQCTVGGVITITFAGQATVNVP